MGETYDKHTLYVSYDGDINSEQIACCFHHAISKLKIPCDFRVNLVTNQSGQKFGYAYVRVSNPKIYHVLIGLDLTGRKITKNIQDPKWKAPEKPLDIALKELKKSFTEDTITNPEIDDVSGWGLEEDDIFSSNSWGCDPVVEDKGTQIKNLKESYNPNMITVEGDQLVTLPKYELSDNQLKLVYQKMLDKEEIDKDTTLEQAIKTGKISKFQKLKVSAAYTPQPTDEYAYLFIVVPKWVTHQMLKAIVGPYASYTKSGKYPMVRERTTKSGKKSFTIYFERGTFDIFFAHLMLRKVPVINKENNEIHTLYFTLSFRNQTK